MKKYERSETLRILNCKFKNIIKIIEKSKGKVSEDEYESFLEALMFRFSNLTYFLSKYYQNEFIDKEILDLGYIIRFESYKHNISKLINKTCKLKMRLLEKTNNLIMK